MACNNKVISWKRKIPKEACMYSQSMKEMVHEHQLLFPVAYFCLQSCVASEKKKTFLLKIRFRGFGYKVNMKRIQPLDLADKDFDHWCSIGESKGLQNDADIACFLLQM